MNQKSSLLSKSACLSLCAIIFILTSLSFGAVAKKTITAIQPISIETAHLQPYTLPKTVVATFSDKSKQAVAVKWTPNKVDTSQIGIKNYTGIVVGTKSKATLTLKVVPTIVSIPETLSQYAVNSEASLPSTVEVVLSNKAVEKRAVTWSQASVKTNELGLFVTTGTVAGTKIVPKHTAKIISDYSAIADLKVTVKLKDAYTLPKEVPATAANGSLSNTPIKWLIANTELDTSKAETLTVEGQALGYEKSVKAVITIEPVIEKVEDKIIELFPKDIYSFPKDVKVTMNDGTTKYVVITWTTPLPNLKVIGKYEVVGSLAGYDKPVKYTFVVKSPFFVRTKTLELTQWGYFAVYFSKPIASNLDPSKMTFYNSNGVYSPIQKLSLSSESDGLIITPSVQMQKGVTYTLIIPAKTLKSIDGEPNEQDIIYVITPK